MTPSSFPTNFDELSKNSRHFDVKINDSILEPLVFIDNGKNNNYIARLAGRKFIRGRETIAYAISLEHDYVMKENIAYPLPRGINKIVYSFLFNKEEEQLSIADLIRIARTKHAPINIHFSESIFSQGKDYAKSEGKNYHAPSLLNATLYQYQSEGVYWITHNIKKK